jgi:predicted lysophospholipase L1 biosynthesis ABC-type transport system permease subunit
MGRVQAGPDEDRRHGQRHPVAQSSGRDPRCRIRKRGTDRASTLRRLIVRGARVAPLVDSALKRVDGRLRATDVRTLDEHLSRWILQERLLGTLSGLFGALSLVLVSVGVYGVMAFQVTRRQKEIGIRMAMGARPVEVTGMVLGETAVPVGAGVAMGVVAALGLTQLAEKMLYGVSPTDPVTFVGAGALLILLAILAAYVPSRRAARLSPVETLRCETDVPGTPALSSKSTPAPDEDPH